MELERIKTKMLAYTDYYGGDFSDTEAIKNATSKKELKAVIEKHRHFLEDMLADACKHLDDFKKKTGLSFT